MDALGFCTDPGEEANRVRSPGFSSPNRMVTESLRFECEGDRIEVAGSEKAEVES